MMACSSLDQELEHWHPHSPPPANSPSSSVAGGRGKAGRVPHMRKEVSFALKMVDVVRGVRGNDHKSQN